MRAVGAQIHPLAPLNESRGEAHFFAYGVKFTQRVGHGPPAPE